MANKTFFNAVAYGIVPLLMRVGIQCIAVLVNLCIIKVYGLIAAGSALTLSVKLSVLSSVATLADEIVVLLLSIICLMPLLRDAQTPFRLHRSSFSPVRTAASVTAATIGTKFLLVILITVTGFAERFSNNRILEIYSGIHPAVRFFAVVIVAPIVEEICYRGVMMNRLLASVRPVVAIVVQAAIFGLMHLNLVTSFLAFIFGIASGILYLRFRELWLCVVAHMAFNITGDIVGLLPERVLNNTRLWHIIILGIGLACVGIYFLIKQPATELLHAQSNLNANAFDPQELVH